MKSINLFRISCLLWALFMGTHLNAQHFFSADGQQIIDSNGDPILLKGTNLGNWLVPEGYMFKTNKVNAPAGIYQLFAQMTGPEFTDDFFATHMDNYVTEQDIAYLKSTGVNHLRLPFHYKMLTNEDYLGVDYHGFHYFDQLIAWAKKYNLPVILDMHCAPGGQTGDNIDDSYGYPYLFTSPKAQHTFLKVWEKIADKYKDEPMVLGYCLINEPIAHYFEEDREMLNAALEPLYKKAVAAIRKIDKNHLIFLSGAQWNGNFDIFTEPFDDLLVYEFHKYWFEVSQAEIQTYLDFRDKHNVPIYVGETGENTDEWCQEFRELLEQQQVNWCYWPYKKMDNTKGFMNFEVPEDYQLIIDYSESDRSTFEKIRENRPDQEKVKQALRDFLDQCLYNNCFENTGYVKALGLESIHQ
ncbi:glycoside hydrolase family 5 protein [Persicobacter psychrovividus]|uniref:Glycoside hydrolase family 5 domain-containing protein n=1 Tax=Persicobacter psychrovividus TaxID=387638 RepID=A0ABN6LDB3_9BACT|nr:hypothetical protein PEPS_34600 [Persicobacter psychrovividus]